jgi:formate C-acetyltransferase
MRERTFARLPSAWHRAYEAGLFTEFMEQRAPGHTALDGTIYREGLRDIQARIRNQMAEFERAGAPDGDPRCTQLEAMWISCEATIRFAERHAELAEQMARNERDEQRRQELGQIARVCRQVPANAPRTFHEAIQMYWFVHLGTITELNGWDAMNPGRLDQHLARFYQSDVEAGTLVRAAAKELLQCLWIKFNNHPAPPKVGVTAAESGTYNDFTNVNVGGLLPDGSDGVTDVSYLLLEVIDEIHLLQPGSCVQISSRTPDEFLNEACRVILRGYGYPAVFNNDAVIEELLRTGKSLQDAREGGVSGCVETGAFGKEAYILTGYLNTPKILELALNNGRDPRTGTQIGPRTGDAASFKSTKDVLAAFRSQLHAVVETKVAGNAIFESAYAGECPAPFLSSVIADCVAKGVDYNAGGARYNTSFIQCVGIGSITDALSAIQDQVFTRERISMGRLVELLRNDFADGEVLRHYLAGSPRYGNDDDRADDLMRQVFDSLHAEIDGRPNGRGGEYHIDMLPTTCHIYFGSVTGATADGRRAGAPFSEGISPVQGADQNGPTAALASAAKLDHLRTCGTLLNMKFSPQMLRGESGVRTLSQLIRSYFRGNGHHIQFNVVDRETLFDAQRNPEAHRDLLVRVAGYSDYFCDIGPDLQNEIINRTEQVSAL